jgi:hypothetical protein
MKRVRKEAAATITDSTILGDFENLSAIALHELADRLLSNEVDAIAECTEFIRAETRGNWHGRARAMMCRRLKHCVVSPEQCEQLVSCITGRLGAGNFSEQFCDQLRLAMCLDRQTTFAAARKNLSAAPKEHVRRFSLWVLEHDR